MRLRMRKMSEIEQEAYDEAFRRQHGLAIGDPAERKRIAQAAKEKAYRQANPEKMAAREAVHKALHLPRAMPGSLRRPDRCERCKKRCKPHGHHPDYTKPLEVEWLCSSCHSKHHAAERWAKRSHR